MWSERFTARSEVAFTAGAHLINGRFDIFIVMNVVLENRA
jgi:hypothetical protein